MSISYPDLARTNYPESMDPNRLFVDVNLENKPYVDLFYQKYNAGDLTGAAQVIRDHPELSNVIINAETMQTIYDMILAGQRFYKSNVEDKIGAIVKYKGNYQANVQYELFNLVVYNGKSYMCINPDTPIGTSPVSSDYFVPQTIQGASGTGLSPRPVWISSEPYSQYDCVPYDNKLFVALRDNIGKVPSNNPDDWATILSVPKQTIFGINTPDGQVENDIWFQTNSENSQVVFHRKKDDGAYEETNLKTTALAVVTDSGSNVETELTHTYIHSKSGTVHDLSGTGRRLDFLATADFVEGDTFSVNGNAVTAAMSNGDTPGEGFFKTANWVSGVILSEGQLFFSSGGSGAGAVISDTAPPNKKMIWVDTTANAALKYWNGTDWVKISAGSVPWAGVTDKPIDFPPSSHTHNYAGAAAPGGAATTALNCTGNADSVDGFHFNWYDDGGYPSYLVGGNSSATQVYPPARLNVGACNDLTFAISAAVPGVINNRITFVYS